MYPDITSLNLQQSLLPLFELFKDPNIVIFLAGAMLALALVILIWFSAKYMFPMLLTLRRVKKQLRTIPNHDAFNTDFTRIDEVISSERFLKHGWDEFKETLIMPAPDKPEPIQNTVRPSVYLNVDSVAGELQLPFYQAIPNYFVGFGLLFTFLGLVAAIYFASQGVAGDIQQAKSSLGDLLNAATFKFTTSIAGLFSSIVLSFFIRVLVLKVQLYFDRFCQLLEERLIFITPEFLAAQQLAELQKQTVQLERFNTDFAVEVAKSLETRLNQSLGTVIGNAIEPMATAIDGMAKNIGEVNQDAMEQMVGEFKSSMQGAAGSEMNALVQTLTSLQDTLQATISGMGQSSGSFGNRLEKAAVHLENIISGASNLMKNSVAESASQLEKVLGDASQAIRTDSEKASEELRSAISEITKEFQDGFRKASIHWNEDLLASADGVKEVVDSAGETLAGRVNGAAQQLDEVVTPFATRIKDLDGTLNTLDGRLKAQLDGFDGSVTLLMELMENMGQSMVRLRDAGTPIAETAGKFSSAAEQIEATAQEVKQTQSHLSDLADSIRDSAKTVQQSWNSYRERFEKVDDDLSEAFSRIQQGTDAYHGRIIEYVQKVDEHFKESLNLLGGGIEQLKDTVDDLTDSADRIARKAV